MKDPNQVSKELREDGLDTNSTYLFINDNTGKYYFGSTNAPARRYRQHVNSLKNQTHVNSLFQEAFNQDPNFTFIVTPMRDRVDAHLFENLLLSEHIEDPNNLNISPPLSQEYLSRQISLASKEIMSANIRERWRDPEFRGKMLDLCKERWKDPAYRENISGSLALARLDPEHKSKTSAKLKASWTEEKRQALAEETKERWKDPAKRASMITGLKEAWTEEKRSERSVAYLEIWKDPELREKSSITSKELWKREGFRENQEKVMKDPIFREKHRASVKAAMLRPEVRAKIESAPNNWDNPLYREKQQRKVSINGVVYDSLQLAAEGVGMSSSGLHYKLNNSKNKPENWFYL